MGATLPLESRIYVAGHRGIDRHGEPLAVGAHGLEPSLDRLQVGTVHMVAPVQDRLGRIDAIAAEHPGIGILTLGVFLGGERVRPAEIVPVVDVIGQRHHMAGLRQFGRDGVGRRTGRAALAGEEFHNGKWALRLRPFVGGGGERREQQQHGREQPDQWPVLRHEPKRFRLSPGACAQPDSTRTSALQRAGATAPRSPSA